MTNLRKLAQFAICITGLITSAETRAQSTRVAASQRGSFLEVDGAKLYYEECGTAPEALVLVHDGVLHSAAWDDVWPEFCRHFHTVRYDRRGYGRSPAATEGYFATDDLAALLRHLKVSHAAIVGIHDLAGSKAYSPILIWNSQRHYARGERFVTAWAEDFLVEKVGTTSPSKRAS
jgi:Alpha/beta hydrolase family